MKRFTILITDDDERILNYLGARLKDAGYEVLCASNGFQALELIRSQEPDLVILDILMPRMDGIKTIKEIRTFSGVHVIFLTARSSDEDKIRGLSQGADDYVAKPFNPDEMIARIESVRRRIEPVERRKARGIFIQDDVVIDFKQRQVTIKGEEQYLTRIEWMLLSELAQSAGRFMTYEDLLTRVWGQAYRGDIQLLRTWINRLRGKLEKDKSAPQIIRTIPKAGYIVHRTDTTQPEI